MVSVRCAARICWESAWPLYTIRNTAHYALAYTADDECVDPILVLLLLRCPRAQPLMHYFAAGLHLKQNVIASFSLNVLHNLASM